MSAALTIEQIIYMSDAEAAERYAAMGSETVTVTLNLSLGLLNYIRDDAEYSNGDVT